MILWIQKLRRAGLGSLALTPTVPAVVSGTGGSVHFQDGSVTHRRVPGCSLEPLSLPWPPYVCRAPHRMAVAGWSQSLLGNSLCSSRYSERLRWEEAARFLLTWLERQRTSPPLLPIGHTVRKAHLHSGGEKDGAGSAPERKGLDGNHHGNKKLKRGLNSLRFLKLQEWVRPLRFGTKYGYIGKSLARRGSFFYGTIILYKPHTGRKPEAASHMLQCRVPLTFLKLLALSRRKFRYVGPFAKLQDTLQAHR